MTEKPELTKMFNQCDCGGGGEIIYTIKIILNKILYYKISILDINNKNNKNLPRILYTD